MESKNLKGRADYMEEINVSGFTSMNLVLAGCSSLRTLDSSNFNTSNVEKRTGCMSSRKIILGTKYTSLESVIPKGVLDCYI